MTDNQTPAYGIDDATLGRAMKALLAKQLVLIDPETEDTYITGNRRGLLAALTVLGPALRAEAFREARLYFIDKWRSGDPINHELFDVLITDDEYESAVSDIHYGEAAAYCLSRMEEAERKHLPTTEPDAEGGGERCR